MEENKKIEEKKDFSIANSFDNKLEQNDIVQKEIDIQNFDLEEIPIDGAVKAFMNNQIENYRKVSLSKEKRKTLQINPETGNVIFEEGTLIHCAHACDYSKLKSISEKGIISGDFLGIPEDGESFYCADFYRADKKMDSSELFERILESDQIFCRGPFGDLPKFRNKLAFIIEPRKDLAPLLDTDMYSLDNNDHIMQSELNLLEEYKTEKKNQIAAIPYGLPPNAISGIIAGDSLLQNKEYIQMLKNLFPESYILTREGKVFFDSILSKEEKETVKIMSKEEKVIEKNEEAKQILEGLEQEKTKETEKEM